VAEKITIDVDVPTASALSNLLQLNTALNSIGNEFRELAAHLRSGGDGMAQFGGKTDGATRELREMSLQGARATGELDKHRAAGIAAAERYLEMGRSGSRATKDVGDGTTMLSGLTRNLTGQVGAWVAGYAGIQGAVNLINALIDRMEKAIETQRKLAGERIEKSGVSQELMANLGLTGAGGEAIAKDLMSRLMKRTGITYEQSGFILGSTASSGQDVRTPGGMAYAEELAAYSRRAGLDKESVLAVTKYAQQQGITDAEGLKLLFAKGDAVQAVAPGLEKAPFWKNLAAGSAAGLSKGVDPDVMAAIFASTMAAGTSEQDAGNMTRMVLALAQGTSGQSRRLMARSAAKLGVTTPGFLDDKVLMEMRDRGNTDATVFLKERPAIEREAKDIDLDARRHRIEVDLRDREIAKVKDPAVRALRRKDAEAKDEDYQRKIQKRREALAERRRKVDQTGRELAEDIAYQSLPLEDRLLKVAFPTLSTDDVNEQNRIIAEFGGQFQMTNSMFTLLGKEGRKRYERALAAGRGATADQTTTANVGFEETDAGKASRVQSQMEASRMGVTDAGAMYAELLIRQAQNQREIDTAQGTRTGAFAGAFTGEASDYGYENEMMEKQLSRDLSVVGSGILPFDEKGRRELKAIATELYRSSRSAHLTPAASRRQDLINVAKRIQALKEASTPRSAGTTDGDVAPPATTQPAADIGPQSDAGWGGGQVIHVGNLWVGGGGELELPGRLDV
jgi:hypothetical protein